MIQKEEYCFSKREQAIIQIEAIYRGFYPLHRKIVDNHCSDFKIITQLGATICESKLETHFIVPTSELITDIIPNQHAYKVVVYNTKEGRFIDGFKGTEMDCIYSVTQWQEVVYGFNFREHNELKMQLESLQNYLDDTSELFSDEENEEFQITLNQLFKKIRLELGLPEEDDEPKTDIHKLLKEDETRKQTYANNNPIDD